MSAPLVSDTTHGERARLRLAVKRASGYAKGLPENWRPVLPFGRKEFLLMPNSTVPESPRRMSIPRSRRLVIDLMWLRKDVPTTAHSRNCDLSPVVAARDHAGERIAWSMLFIKAYAIVAKKYPPLRQVFMKWPWPHLFQNPASVASVVTHRDVDGEPWLFWTRFIQPESQSLVNLQRQMDAHQSDPVQQIFRREWVFSGFPTPLRRILWWWTINVSGRKRVKRCGTFCLTTIGSRGAEICDPPGFLTGNLTFGPIDATGGCRITLSYDHRLLDGRMVADILADVEQTLNTLLVAELQKISSSKRDAAESQRAA